MKRVTLVSLVLFCMFSCKKEQQHKKENTDQGFIFYLGTYTGNNSEGIYKYQLNSDGTMNSLGLVAKTENPSYLAKSKNGKYLLAVNEISNKDTVGTVSSFLIQKDTLNFINKSSSGGAHPCFVSINDEGYVLAANYTGGNVGLLKIGEGGQLSDLLYVQQHSGKGTTDRQDAPHAHSSYFLPDHKTVIAADLGTNELWLSELDVESQSLKPSTNQKIKMNDGAGPRHLAFNTNDKWIYSLNELNNTVAKLQKNENDGYEIVSITPTLPDDFKEYNTSADIHISSNGKFLYTSNRGHNSIAIFKINDQNGNLMPIDHISTKGKTPRNFALSPDENYVLVANQETNNIVSFKRDNNTGNLTFVDEIEAPTPVCILF